MRRLVLICWICSKESLLKSSFLFMSILGLEKGTNSTLMKKMESLMEGCFLKYTFAKVYVCLFEYKWPLNLLNTRLIELCMELLCDLNHLTLPLPTSMHKHSVLLPQITILICQPFFQHIHSTILPIFPCKCSTGTPLLCAQSASTLYKSKLQHLNDGLHPPSCLWSIIGIDQHRSGRSDGCVGVFDQGSLLERWNQVKGVWKWKRRRELW